MARKRKPPSKRPLRIGYPVEVTWHDATSRTEWLALGDHQAQTPMQVKSTGYVIRLTAKTVQIVQSWRAPVPDEPQVVADSLTIPRGWVRSVRRLR